MASLVFEPKSPSPSLATDLLKTEDLRTRFRRLLQTADLGISEIQETTPKVLFDPSALVAKGKISRNKEFNKKTMEEVMNELIADVVDRTLFEPWVEFLHLGRQGKAYPLNPDEESLGTQRYLFLNAECLRAHELKSLLVIDEFDTSLHPFLSRQILLNYCCDSHKENSGQFIFTTHNPLLLDQTLLRRDQIWFTEKDQEGATRLYPLTDFKPRKDESLVKGYLAGRYGGIPFIPEGLKF